MLRARSVILFSLMATLSTAGCGGKKEEPNTPTAVPPAPPVSRLASLFPLEDGKMYHYVTHDGPDTGMLVAKVHRSDPTHGELRLSNGAKRFVLAPDGVAFDVPDGAYILKAPVEVGNAWPGEHGGTTTIASVDTAVTVPAGSYASCVMTVEEGGRLPGVRYETTYCPGVGMVLLVVHAPGVEARAELRSYGAPVKIE